MFVEQDRVLRCIDIKGIRCLCYNCTEQQKRVPCLQPHHATVFEQNVYVWRSQIHNFGLFARNNMLPKDIICLYSGVRREEPIEGNVFTCKIKSITVDTQDFYIDSNDPQNYCGRWMNHSKSPNARLVIPLGGVIRCRDKEKCAILVECITNIKQGEEILIDYGK